MTDQNAYVPQPTVAQLLAASRAAHLQKKHASGRVNTTGVVVQQPDYDKATAHVAEALRLRLQAHEQDPEHTDSAWTIDQTLNGCDHDTLVRFFQRYLVTP